MTELLFLFPRDGDLSAVDEFLANLTAQPGRLTFRDDLGPPLSIASVDAAGGSPSIVVRDVQAFDVGFPD